MQPYVLKGNLILIVGKCYSFGICNRLLKWGILTRYHCLIKDLKISDRNLRWDLIDMKQFRDKSSYSIATAKVHHPAFTFEKGILIVFQSH